MTNLEVLLNEEIADLVTKMKNYAPSTDEYKAYKEAVTELTDRVIELKKLEMDNDVSYSQMAHETEVKKMEIEAEAKTNKINGIINAAGIIIPSAVTVWGTCKTFKFEGADGIFTSTTSKQFINKLFRK